jgi:hypothetical protein
VEGVAVAKRTFVLQCPAFAEDEGRYLLVGTYPSKKKARAAMKKMEFYSFIMVQEVK